MVRTYPIEDFPGSPPSSEGGVDLPAQGLAEALRQVVRAASGDDARPLLTGVLIAAEGDGIRLVATDSYRLAMRDLSAASPLPAGTDQILVPARALGELQRLLPSKEPAKDADATGGTTVGFSVEISTRPSPWVGYASARASSTANFPTIANSSRPGTRTSSVSGRKLCSTRCEG